MLRTFHVLIFLSSLLLFSCSSGISVTTTRFSGVLLDRSMNVEVGRIYGNDAEEFRFELQSALRSQGSFGSSPSPYATLLVEGSYTATVDESTSSETENGNTVETTEQEYTAQFEYRIIHRETGEEITFGNLVETTSRSRERKNQGFFEAILDAVVSVIISGDPYASLREDLISRFIAEISPRELLVEVTLFEDSDMPELEQGIRQAKAGRWKESLGIFLDAAERYRGYENVHKAYFNAGVAYEYTHQYSLAREFIERAITLSPEEEYLDELQRCIRYEQEWRWREGYLEKLRMVKAGPTERN